MSLDAILKHYSYHLPEGQIARYPLEKRHDSRLLCLLPEQVDSQISELARHLNAGDLLVFNNTQVMSARCHLRRQTGGKVEILICAVLNASHVHVLAKPSRKLRSGEFLSPQDDVDCQLELLDALGEGIWLARCLPDAKTLMDTIGKIPIPPYFQREATPEDGIRYQTIFAKKEGAVAAPTAGLHFTEDLFERLDQKGVGRAFLTLHVGIGTFQNLRESNIVSGQLHSEWYELDQENAEKIRQCKAAGGRVIAVGTTSTRCLESIARQYGEIRPDTNTTSLFIRESFSFQVIDGLLTNFHLPMSSLLMLVCAFGGHQSVMSAYRHAVSSGYRFYSYGDAMLLTPHKH